jgi:hypothetical protein
MAKLPDSRREGGLRIFGKGGDLQGLRRCFTDSQGRWQAVAPVRSASIAALQPDRATPRESVHGRVNLPEVHFHEGVFGLKILRCG